MLYFIVLKHPPDNFHFKVNINPVYTPFVLTFSVLVNE